MPYLVIISSNVFVVEMFVFNFLVLVHVPLVQTEIILTKISFLNFFYKSFGGPKSFCGANDSPVLDFWWRLLLVLKTVWVALFALGQFSRVWNDIQLVMIMTPHCVMTVIGAQKSTINWNKWNSMDIWQFFWGILLPHAYSNCSYCFTSGNYNHYSQLLASAGSNAVLHS